MTFLNQPLLWGLIGISIPIIIHLLNRRKAAVVEWGAMRFLLASLASRNRRILLEEILLMALRCLAVGLIAAAMARPLLSSGGEQWALGLAALPVAAVLGATAAVMWSRRLVRWACLAACAAVVLVAAAALARQDWELGRKWTGDSSARDVAIVLDGSLSMTLRADGATNFDRALEDARAVVASCRPSDTVSILLGGSTPREVVVPGISDRKELLARLDGLKPAGGSLRVIPSLLAAGEALAKGHNPGKSIVLITDGQAVGWSLPSAVDSASAVDAASGRVTNGQGASDTKRPDGAPTGQNEDRWRWLGGNLSAVGREAPKVVCRLLPAPASFTNLCVEEVKFARNVVGPDRPVRIDVKVSNTGDSLASGAAVELFADGAAVDKQNLEPIPPHASQGVHFERQFERPGAKLIEARLTVTDDLPGDDSAFARLNVLEELPVLVVEGAPSAEPLGGASAFIQIALSPGAEGRAGRPAAGSRPAFPASAPENTTRDVVRMTAVTAAELAAQDLNRYRVVVLAGAATLPEAVARELAAFVQRGGGLLLLPGEFQGLGAEVGARFYDGWMAPSGKPLSPARFARRLDGIEPPARLAPRAFAHPALDVLADPARSGAGEVRVRSYWELGADEKDPDVRVGGRLDSGAPFLVDRKVGRGRTVVLAVSLDERQSDLPASKPCFVPLVRELVYYLAGATADQGNFPGGQEAALDAPAWLVAAAGAAGGLLEVRTPTGARAMARIVDSEGVRRLTCWDTESPGAYRVVTQGVRGGAANSAERQGAPRAQPSTTTGGATTLDTRGGAGAPLGTNSPRNDSPQEFFFVVSNNPQESRLERLAPADLQAAQKYVPISTALTTQDLTACLRGETPGTEIWQRLVVAAILALVLEIALARWITRRRGSGSAAPVAFGKEPLDVKSFRDRAKEMLTVPQTGSDQSTNQPVNQSTNE